MEKLIFDNGIKEYEVNGNGVLRFNPSDPNLYARFLGANDKIRAIEEELLKQGEDGEDNETAGARVLRQMEAADKKMKALLSDIFGAGNDFDKILDGVNLLAVASNGERVINNLMDALAPIMSAGAKACAGEKVEQAKQNRAKRRANK